MKTKIICFLLIVSVIMSAFYVIPFAASDDSEIAQAPLSVAIEVKERNGIDTSNQLTKRGFPVKKGTIFDTESLKLTDLSNGKIVDCVFEIMEYNDDNSASWISAAFLAEAKANETKQYIVTNDGAGYNMETDLVVKSDDNGIELSNEYVKLTAGTDGINGIYYRHNNILNQIGVKSYTRYCSKNVFVSAAWKVLEQNPLYATIRVVETLSDKTEVEWDVTLVRDSKEFIVQSRFVVKKTGKLDSEVHRFNLLKSFSPPEFSDGKGTAGDAIHYSSWSKSYNPSADLSFYIVSEDIAKFKGAMGEVKNNGFINPLDSKLEFAPIHYKADYNWVDGQSRTVHFVMGLCSGRAEGLDTKLLQRTTSLSAVVEPRQFVEGGIVEELSLSPVTRRQIDSLLWTKDKRYARVDAGSIPFGLEKDFLNACTMFEERNGETDYNYWFAQIMSGSEDVFDIIYESSYVWADFIVSRGGKPAEYGLTRRRTYTEGNHPYYGDMSGLYMSYLMTGNNYFRELFKIACDGHYNSVVDAPFGAVHSGAGEAREIRFVMMARALLFGYKLFRDERYLETAKNTVAWAKYTQDPAGYFPQYTFYDTGLPHTVSVNGHKLYKNYLTLYGIRGVCPYYEETGDEVALNMLKGFADYLLTEIQDDGWMWDPMGDTSVAITGEDYSRGLAPMQEIMSTEVMDTVFRATGDTRYLEAMLKQLRYYIASADPSGLVAQRYNDPNYVSGSINGTISAQPSMYVRIMPRLRHTMKENMDFLIDNGYEDVYYATSNDAGDISSTIKSGFPLKEFSIQSFTTPNGNFVYMANKSGKLSGTWNKIVNCKISDGKKLWFGAPVEVKKDGVYVKDNLDYFDMLYVKEIPVRLTSFENSVSANVEKYSSDEIIISCTLGGSYANFEVTDGTFEITDGKKYDVKISGPISGKKITITQSNSGKYKASNGKINFDMGGFVLSGVFDDTKDHWAEDTITELASTGVIKGISDSEFAPENSMTVAQFSALALRSIGIDTEGDNSDWEKNVMTLAVDNELCDTADNGSDFITREKAVDILVKSVNIKSDVALDVKYGIDTTEIVAVPDANVITNDKEAVKADAEALHIGNTDITNDITLPIKGIYGTLISWDSSDETLISSTGKVTRPSAYAGDAKVTLSATISKGKEKYQKNFELNVRSYSNVNWLGKRKVEEDCVYDVETVDGDEVVINFEAFSNGNSANSYIGFAGNNAISSDGDVPVLLRLRADNEIDAVNGDGFARLNKVAYEQGKPVKFSVYIHLSSSCYDAFVILPCGEWVQIADDFLFNSSAPSTDAVTKCFVFANNGIGDSVGVNKIDCAKNGDNSYRINENNIFIPIVQSAMVLPLTDSFNRGLYWHSSNPSVISDNGKVMPEVTTPCKVSFVCETDRKHAIADFDKCSAKYIKNIITAYSASLISGSNTNEFMPSDALTRAQGATMIKRLMDYVG